jgi:hypothetical protein
MSEETELLREIRDLLLLLAEPAIAKRDESHRAALRELVGRSRAKANAVAAMDGSRSRQVICKESGIDQGDLSRLIKVMRERKLIVDGDMPKLAISLPPAFFE